MSIIDDDRFDTGAKITAKQLRALQLPYFAKQVDEEYFSTDVLRLTAKDTDAYAAFAKICHELIEATVEEVLAGEYREEFGLTQELWSLAVSTWRAKANHPHVFGRFDVAGVLDGGPAKLIEYNADTATVLAEATLVQPLQAGGQTQWNDIVSALADGLADLALARPPDERDVLVVTLGGAEDDDNARVWLQAAQSVGLRSELAHLPSVHFAPGEGVFRELNEDEWVRYGIIVKLLPWDWIANEEPEFLYVLAQLIREGDVVVVNPPYASLMQSKATLAELARRYPNTSELLSAGWGAKPPSRGTPYVTKPIFGREGENVQVFTAEGQLREEAPGDYDEQPRIWQEYLALPQDSDGDIYQAGVYWAGGACGVAFRRRDGLITDEDSEFVSHVVRS